MMKNFCIKTIRLTSNHGPAVLKKRSSIQSKIMDFGEFFMSVRFLKFLLFFLLWIPFINYAQKPNFDYEALHAEAVEESLIPIRPGNPGGSPFWNAHAIRFITAPSFNFNEVDGAVTYRYIVSVVDNEDYIKDYVFEAETPWADLSPVWKDVPVGNVYLSVEGLNGSGKVLGIAGTRNFYRAAVFHGPYREKIMDYTESATLALKELFNLDYYQSWVITGKPDSSAYKLYCYPSKMESAVIEGMLTYARLSPGDAKTAIEIAVAAADYLMSVSEPTGSYLEYFPPTYEGTATIAARSFKGQIMMHYPARVGNAYLDLYNITKNEKYFKAARRIADTYVLRQLPGGTWYLKINAKTGKPIKNYKLNPIDIIIFLDKLINKYDCIEYKTVRDHAFNWIKKGPLSDFHWAGQFEDNGDRGKLYYKNLTHAQACTVARYLMDHRDDDSTFLQKAMELLRFAEDQFVVWEKPSPKLPGCFASNRQIKSDVHTWVTPVVLEQYGYYMPVDASGCGLIRTYKKAYEITGRRLYLAKAYELANTALEVQNWRRDNLYQTLWLKDPVESKDLWLNCATYTAKTLLELNQSVDTTSVRYK